jgi:alpha-1,2-mannosyltransferase
MSAQPVRTPEPGPRSPGDGVSVAWRGALALGLVGFFIWRSFFPHAADFKTFYSAGYAITHSGVPLYDTKELHENPFGQVFKLPPSAALYLAPLQILPLQEARLAWRILLVMAYVAAFALLCRVFGVPLLSAPWLGGLAAWCAFAPAQIAVGEGQWDTPFLLLLAVAAAGACSARATLAALPIAVAASIKPYPLIVALFFVGRRWWKGLGTTIVATVALVLAGALAAGAEETRVFLLEVLPASGATTAYPDNQTLSGTLARLVSDDLKPFPLRGQPAVDLAIRLIALAVCGACTWLVWRAPGHDGLERTLQLGLLVAVSILVIPAAWSHYQTILLLPLFVLAVDQARRRPRGWAGWLLLAIGFVLTALPNPAIIIGEEVDRELWIRSRADGANLALQRDFPTALSRLVLSYKTLGTVLVAGLVAWRVARPPAPATDLTNDATSSLPSRTVAGLAGAGQGAGG